MAPDEVYLYYSERVWISQSTAQHGHYFAAGKLHNPLHFNVGRVCKIAVDIHAHASQHTSSFRG